MYVQYSYTKILSDKKPTRTQYSTSYLTENNEILLPKNNDAKDQLYALDQGMWNEFASSIHRKRNQTVSLPTLDAFPLTRHCDLWCLCNESLRAKRDPQLGQGTLS